MNEEWIPVSNVACAVPLGDLTLYVTAWGLIGKREVRQQISCSGNACVTNSGIYARTITLKGKLAVADSPEETAAALDSILQGSNRYSFGLGNMHISFAFVTGYQIQHQQHRGILEVTVELLTLSAITTGEETNDTVDIANP